MEDRNTTFVVPVSSDSNPSPVQPKKVGRPPNRRPKVIPVKMRQRLTNLGMVMKNNDTTNSNLNTLIDKLSDDLHRYSIAADLWQKRTLALKASIEEEQREKLEAVEAQEMPNEEISDIFYTPGALSHFEMDLLRKLRQNISPSLTSVVPLTPSLRSGVESMKYVATNEVFLRVLGHVSSVGHLFGVYKPMPGEWSQITRLKPNFDEGIARKVWRSLFTSIDTPISSLEWNSGPSGRQNERGVDLNDPDYDALDRILAKSSDRQVLELLHYSSLLLLGLNHSVSDDPSMKASRDHLGRQVERLIHEAVVLRNISTNPEFAAEFVCSLVDSIYHFSFEARNGALGSLLEMAWSACSAFPNIIHPIIKSLIVFESTIWAPNNSRRAVWMARNEELMKSTDRPYFHLVSTTWFTSCFYALAIRDEESLLYYLSKLDVILAPNEPEKSSDSFDQLSAAYMDELPIGVHPIRTGQMSQPPSPPTQSNWNQNRAELDDLWNQFHQTDQSSSSTSETSFSSTPIFENIDTSTFIEDEEAKICLRSAVHFIRAEAAIISQDHEHVYQWLDEAEKEIKKLHNPILFQKLLLTDIPTFRFAFGSKFHFPSGARCIAQELDLRVEKLVTEFKLRNQPHPSSSSNPPVQFS